jgi:putative acetyltransferase
MLIRRETPNDVGAIRSIIGAAFVRPERPGMLPPEVTLVEELRASNDWLPALSLVAVNSEGDVAGHVLCTRGRVDSAPVLALGPLAVDPDQQRHGVGRALMHAILGAAEALDEPLIGVLGDPGYYSRFGFRLAEEYGIKPPVSEWRPHFQIGRLARTLRWCTDFYISRTVWPTMSFGQGSHVASLSLNDVYRPTFFDVYRPGGRGAIRPRLVLLSLQPAPASVRFP